MWVRSCFEWALRNEVSSCCHGHFSGFSRTRWAHPLPHVPKRADTCLGRLPADRKRWKSASARSSCGRKVGFVTEVCCAWHVGRHDAVGNVGFRAMLKRHRVQIGGAILWSMLRSRGCHEEHVGWMSFSQDVHAWSCFSVARERCGNVHGSCTSARQ